MDSQPQTGTKKYPEVGDLVLYVLEGGRSEGQVRPAFIVRIFDALSTTGGQGDISPPQSLEAEAELPMVNLQVFTDGSNDGYDSNTGGLAWKTSRHFNSDKMPGTWHYPLSIPQQIGNLAASQDQIGSKKTEPEPELALNQVGDSRGIF